MSGLKDVPTPADWIAKTFQSGIVHRITALRRSIVCNAIQYSAVQSDVVQRNSAQCNAEQCSAV
jgi:hypothetical protein